MKTSSIQLFALASAISAIFAAPVPTATHLKPSVADAVAEGASEAFEAVSDLEKRSRIEPAAEYLDAKLDYIHHPAGEELDYTTYKAHKPITSKPAMEHLDDATTTVDPDLTESLDEFDLKARDASLKPRVVIPVADGVAEGASEAFDAVSNFKARSEPEPVRDHVDSAVHGEKYDIDEDMSRATYKSQEEARPIAEKLANVLHETESEVQNSPESHDSLESHAHPASHDSPHSHTPSNPSDWKSHTVTGPTIDRLDTITASPKHDIKNEFKDFHKYTTSKINEETKPVTDKLNSMVDDMFTPISDTFDSIDLKARMEIAPITKSVDDAIVRPEHEVYEDVEFAGYKGEKEGKPVLEKADEIFGDIEEVLNTGN